MASLTESPAILTVHAGSPGQYVIRVSDVSHRPLVIGVTKLLSSLGGAESFVLVTPTDIKVFASTAGNGDAAAATDDGIDGTSTLADAAAPPQLDSETQAAIDAELRSTPPRTTPTQPVTDEPAAEPADDAPPKPRRRKPYESAAGHDEACGRCSGVGRIRVLVDGGAAAETACGICQGKGTIKRYGVRR